MWNLDTASGALNTGMQTAPTAVFVFTKRTVTSKPDSMQVSVKNVNVLRTHLILLRLFSEGAYILISDELSVSQFVTFN